jgi:hypothetical protein
MQPQIDRDVANYYEQSDERDRWSHVYLSWNLLEQRRPLTKRIRIATMHLEPKCSISRCLFSDLMGPAQAGLAV